MSSEPHNIEQTPEKIQSELETFRAQWRAEVTARSKKPEASQPSSQAGPSSSASKPPRKPDASQKRTAVPKGAAQLEDDDEYVQGHAFDELSTHGAAGEPVRVESSEVDNKEPETALEFYEKAVDRETTGKLGDSLRLYRKAFRMDSRVDQDYKNKHFPGRWKPAQINPSNAPITVPNVAQHSLDGPTLSLPDLIASFAGMSVQGSTAEVEGMPTPPCPISDLPDEILLHILRDVAILDVGDFVRLSQVCKRFAYLIATEDQIWRRVCLGSEFGFGSMVYHWQKEITWETLDPELQLGENLCGVEELQQRRADESEATTHALIHTLYASSWLKMFRQRPRIRFNGCYISTVNYIRAGQASGHHITWNSPVHIVTYYRYLRFFRDGAVISLLTTDEPKDVVHHLTKDNLMQHQNNGAPHLPSAVISGALKGRWRLSSTIDNPDGDLADVEGDLFVETNGVGPKYMYRMELSLKSAGKAAKNNKLMWKGFWSYNKLTDDWGEFTLKNDKAFYFSRVKSYGFRGQ
ncbi:uncharacterized protein BCR38DRAFT_453185 [Pseudomassariella vexata]|uniref:F-box domain-containing protein n=1 Tax=Pseudomassariella vexata TaxID=1141098 RepID=A0A1Y2D6Y1_9PEZI|nr:uncharacterized protein BCR38DRAFT_453185 [Pseudomassariella vexata]ORY54826.1 hypothetical protein BCR38DRAFT_453185 [Pseudomassariella vexata]